jgi:hypothetical protein
MLHVHLYTVEDIIIDPVAVVLARVMPHPKNVKNRFWEGHVNNLKVNWKAIPQGRAVMPERHACTFRYALQLDCAPT